MVPFVACGVEWPRSLVTRPMTPDRWQQLHNQIAGLVGDERPAAEVELDCDFGLKYEHVIEAITAVSGSVAPGGRIEKLVEKIKFSPPRPE